MKSNAVLIAAIILGMAATYKTDALPAANAPVRISWEVKNRFRLFREEKDFLLHADAMRRHSNLESEREVARLSERGGWERNLLDRRELWNGLKHRLPLSSEASVQSAQIPRCTMPGWTVSLILAGWWQRTGCAWLAAGEDVMKILAIALGLCCASITSTLAQSDYPNRTVRIVIGFSPGSVADTPARLLAQRFSTAFGQQVIVENKPGAGSNIAAEYVARAPKDGYTLLMATAAQAINATTSPNLTFDFQKDFTAIAQVATVPNLLVAHPSFGAKTLSDVIAIAKQKPGEIVYGSSGVGTSTHLAGELVNVMAGIKLGHVPYPGSSQSLTDVLTGRIPLLFVPAAPAMQYVEKGQLVPIAVTQPRRSSIAPNVPTMSEAGLPGYDIGLWFALVAPAGTPADAISRLARATNEAMQQPDLVKALQTAGIEPVTDSTPESFARYIDTEIKKYAKVAKAAGLVK
jgi:tripartite-type tricarboxylate transporter receptor subunit TctC